MDGERWWIVDEIARWWRASSQEQRFVLMQRVRDGAKEASLQEVIQGALRAELADNDSPEIAEIVARWASGKGVRRC